MNHFRTILAALLFAAAPAAGQTIKTLGYNTTNGDVVAATNLIFTNTNTTFQNATISDQTLTLSHGPEDDVFIRNESGNLELGSLTNVFFWLDSAVQSARFNVPFDFNNSSNAAVTRTNLGLGQTNSVTFSNITTSGTLTATGNITMSGTGNTAPNQTASSGSSLMTRALADARYLGLKSHQMNFSLSGTRSSAGGSSTISGRGSWQLFTATNVSSYSAIYAEWAYLLGIANNIRTVNFSNQFIIAFTRVNQLNILPRSGLTQYVQLGRDASATATGGKLASKGVGVQFTSNGVTPFVHNGTLATDGATVTNITDYNRFLLNWVPGTAFEFYGIKNGDEPVLLGSVTSNLPTGLGTSEATLEFSSLDSGSGGGNNWLQLNSVYIITP